MIIKQSSVNLSSSHQKISVKTEKESLRAWVDLPAGGRTETEDPESLLAKNLSKNFNDRVELGIETYKFSAESFSSFSKMNEIKIQKQFNSEDLADQCKCKKKGEQDEDELLWSNDARLVVMKQIIEAISGVTTKIIRPSDLSGDSKENPISDIANSPEGNSVEEQPQTREGWGIEYLKETASIETEQTAFSSSGVIRTADGREIGFEVDLEMSRSRIDFTRFELRAGDAAIVDPLVINFNGTMAELEDAKLSFDLNSDGKDEMISFVKSGSGFLFYDRNFDGIVNNGSELFGPTTGNGFAELAQLDEDGNGWIDEADTAWNQLGVWMKDSTDSTITKNLKEANVGAIYLGNVSTPFEHKDSEGNLKGITQATGVYLSEDGIAGTVQQVDLVT